MPRIHRFARYCATILLGALLTMSSSSAFAADARSETAIFAGGCFWCMEPAFTQLPGVTKVTSGYTGGTVADPTYEQVSSGQTGHIEAVEVVYNPDKISYQTLLSNFWDNVDPTDPRGQFCDKGSQYAAGIFYSTPDQQKEAEASIAAVEAKLKLKVATFLRPAKPFYEAEEYHQSYSEKNALRYALYKQGCGRNEKLEEIWGKKPQH